MDDGRLALVQASHGLTGVTEDVKDLGLAEAHIQPLVHLLHHLTRCRRESTALGGNTVPASMFGVWCFDPRAVFSNWDSFPV